jgi:alkaline phosphatase D
MNIIADCVPVVRRCYIRSALSRCLNHYEVHRQQLQPKKRNVTTEGKKSILASPLRKLKCLPKRIVFGSCSAQIYGDLTYWDRIVEAKPDLIILMGDNVYAPTLTEQQEHQRKDYAADKTSDGTDNGDRGKIRSIMDSSYSTLGANSNFRRAACTIPILATLDDNDYSFRNLDKNSMTDDDIDNQLEAAKISFLDFFQVEKSDARWNVGRGVYTSYDFYLNNDGQVSSCSSSSTEGSNPSTKNVVWRVQIILLDVRRHKSPFALHPTTKDRNDKENPEDSGTTAGPYIPSDNALDTMLGADQWQWLEEQLRYVPPEKAPNVRLIVSPVQVLSDGRHGWDCWNLFPHERERLLSLLHPSPSPDATEDDNQFIPTFVLSGDRHVAGFYEEQMEITDRRIVEVTSSSLTHSVPAGLLDHEYDSARIGSLIYGNNFGLLQFENILLEDEYYTVSIHSAETGDLMNYQLRLNQVPASRSLSRA